MQVGRRQIGPFEALCHEPDGAEGAVVLAHGFGANAFDLWPLAELLQTNSKTAWYFPNAPIKLFPGGGDFGRAWFPLDVEQINQQLSAGDFGGITKFLRPGLQAAGEQMSEFLTALPLPRTSVVVGGFSQGAMLAVQASLTGDVTPAGLIAFSGALVDNENWATFVKQHPQLRVLQSHGRQDPVLPFFTGERLSQLWEQNQVACEFIPFEGDHTIPMPVLERAKVFLQRCLADLPAQERST